MAEKNQAVSITLVSFVTKFPFGRGNIGTPSVQGSGLSSTQVDKKDAHVFFFAYGLVNNHNKHNKQGI